MTLSYRTLHLSRLPVYTEDYCGINETDSHGKEEDKSKQKESGKKKSVYFAELYVKVLNSDLLWFDALILKN